MECSLLWDVNINNYGAANLNFLFFFDTKHFSWYFATVDDKTESNIRIFQP